MVNISIRMAHISLYSHVHLQIQMCIYIYVYTYICIYVYICVFTSMFISVFVQTYAHSYLYMCVCFHLFVCSVPSVWETNSLMVLYLSLLVCGWRISWAEEFGMPGSWEDLAAHRQKELRK